MMGPHGTGPSASGTVCHFYMSGTLCRIAFAHQLLRSKLGMDAGSNGGDVELLRVHEAAGLALVRTARDDSTKWIPWPPPPLPGHHREPSIALKKEHFAHNNAHFQVIASADGHPPQNVLILLHGRGDNEEPFAKLGAQMALPQTGPCFVCPVVALGEGVITVDANGYLSLVCLIVYLYA